MEYSLAKSRFGARLDRSRPGALASKMLGGIILNHNNINEETKKLYGLDNEVTKGIGRQLLTTRRLLDKGVKVVNVNVGGADEKKLG